MKQTAVHTIENACNDFCDNFCKYSEKMQGMSEQECDKMTESICEKKYPINKLI